MTTDKKREAKTRAKPASEEATPRDDWASELRELTYNQARTALEVALGQLQSEDIEVEAMADLYRRALAYAQRCEQVLQQVEQEIIQYQTAELEGEP
ncbi:exodeoxyribonuclease VII small subunit [Synechococcus sp. Tobar12-5m-g]|jgi:exodeoxyribonuclease VII small subunit|uniref:exodeoxyribonuclease VII small subunit n=1 Tax=unclassified Synechococcus TaxID=2626047 RepID=UPI0020CE998A|nr:MULTISPECIES: exodeoxyribonuclease VII small subunit [unclassified Synechococcus]MCP9772713.1 exodeoxyribonuclease VII small subunit [Synechococcus sp. Tobar12-5m-g]MCP9873433.1 exodeoxyribonuclease VII small subunit [Synechococcus sp. Cruz CV-v-12]